MPPCNQRQVLENWAISRLTQGFHLTRRAHWSDSPLFESIIGAAVARLDVDRRRVAIRED